MISVQEQLKQLYRDGFDATEDYIQFFFSRYVNLEDAVIRFDGEKAVSVAYVLNKPFVLRGKKTCLGFLSSISTRSELRGKRLVEEVMSRAFDKIVANGNYLVALYPFKHEYYRKYGFVSTTNTSCEKLSFRGGNLTRINADIPTLKTIYEEYCKNFDAFIVRSNFDWENLLIDWSTSGDVVEVFQQNDKRCYISYGNSGVNEAAGDLDLLNSVRHLEGLTVERFGREQEGTMFRVVDAKKALENATYLRDGEFVFSLTDSFMPMNQANYLLKVKNSVGSVSLTDKNGEKISVEQLTKAVIGEESRCSLDIFLSKQKIFCLDKY